MCQNNLRQESVATQAASAASDPMTARASAAQVAAADQAYVVIVGQAHDAGHVTDFTSP